MPANIILPARIIGIALIVTVLSQIAYMVFLGGPSPADPEQGVVHSDVVRYFTDEWPRIATVWTTEIIAFGAIALAGFVLMARLPAFGWAFAAIAISGVINLIQVGMGLSMFRPFALSGEEYGALTSAIVSGSFFFYFLGKLFLGLAAAAVGMAAWRMSTGLGKIAGLLSALAGLAAIALNGAAIPQIWSLTFAAGAAGTAAALFLALTLLLWKPASTS